MAADSDRLSQLSLRNHQLGRAPRPCHGDHLRGTSDPEQDKRLRSHPDQVFVYPSKVYEVFEVSRSLGLVFPTHAAAVRPLGRWGQSTLLFVSHSEDTDIARTREDIKVLLGVRPARALAVLDVRSFLEDMTSSPDSLQLAHSNLDQSMFSEKYRLMSFFRQQDSQDETEIDWLRAPVPLSWDKMKAAMEFRKSLLRRKSSLLGHSSSSHS